MLSNSALQRALYDYTKYWREVISYLESSYGDTDDPIWWGEVEKIKKSLLGDPSLESALTPYLLQKIDERSPQLYQEGTVMHFYSHIWENKAFPNRDHALFYAQEFVHLLRYEYDILYQVLLLSDAIEHMQRQPWWSKRSLQEDLPTSTMLIGLFSNISKNRLQSLESWKKLARQAEKRRAHALDVSQKLHNITPMEVDITEALSDANVQPILNHMTCLRTHLSKSYERWKAASEKTNWAWQDSEANAKLESKEMLKKMVESVEYQVEIWEEMPSHWYKIQLETYERVDQVNDQIYELQEVMENFDQAILSENVWKTSEHLHYLASSATRLLLVSELIYPGAQGQDCKVSLSKLIESKMRPLYKYYFGHRDDSLSKSWEKCTFDPGGASGSFLTLRKQSHGGEGEVLKRYRLRALCAIMIISSVVLSVGAGVAMLTGVLSGSSVASSSWVVSVVPFVLAVGLGVLLRMYESERKWEQFEKESISCLENLVARQTASRSMSRRLGKKKVPVKRSTMQQEAPLGSGAGPSAQAVPQNMFNSTQSEKMQRATSIQRRDAQSTLLERSFFGESASKQSEETSISTLRNS